MPLTHLRALALMTGTLAVTGATAQPASTGSGQAYPAKPIRIVVGFVPGGGSDFIARLVSAKLTESLGRTVIVENRPGAGAVIATEFVAKAPADGYTLLLGSAGPFGIVPALNPKTPYDSQRDFDPITLVVIMPFLMTVHPSLPVKNVKDLVALAKTKPGQLNFGSPGHGSTNHLANEMLKLMTKIDLTHVPYKGVSAAMTDVIAGQIQILSGDLTTLLPPVKAGRLRAVAVTSGKRSSIAPDIPTIAESGVPGFEVSGWYGFLAPRAVPRNVVTKLHAETKKSLESETMKDRLRGLGLDIIAGGSYSRCVGETKQDPPNR